MKSFTCYSHSGQSGPLDLPATSSSSSHSAHQGFSNGEIFPNLASNWPKRKTGRKKFRETRHPVYRGVRRRNGSKWVCEVREPNKKSRIWLGTFPNPEMAARAHDVAAMALHGRSAILNFADSAWLLPVPATASAKDIQKTAAEAAKAFRSISQPHTVFEGNDDTLENVMYSSENMFYMDDEAIFDMPGLLLSMAEGLLVSPPPFDQSGFEWVDMDCNADLPLWSYSI